MGTLFQSAIKDFRQSQYQYWSKRLKSISQTAYEKIIPVLADKWLDEQSFVLLLTGSDWRKENRTDASSVEMIAYINQESVSREIVQEIAKNVGELFMWYNRLSLAKKIYWTNKVEVEPKNFKDVGYFDDPYSGYKTIFPTRFMDGALIYWNNTNYETLYNEFACDLQKINAHSLNQFSSRVKYAKDINDNGNRMYKGNLISHINREKKEIYYQKTAELETGVKMWQLRYVQYKLWYLITQLIRSKKIDYTAFKEVEWFMHNKIEFLRDYVKGGMDEVLIEDLSLIYYTFLKIHHICQKEYKNVEWVYVYNLKDDEEKLLKDMSIRLDAILSGLTVL